MIEDYEPNIKEMLVNLENTYKQIEICKPSEKQGLIDKVKQDIQNIESELDMFDSEIQIEDASTAKQYKSIFNVLQADLKRLKDEFEMKKMQGAHIQEELDKINSMSAEQLQSKAIDHGDKLLAKRNERAKNILFTINQANMMVADINDEIKEQNQRMMDMEEIIKDSQSSLNRANEMLGYFAKAFYRDIVLKILIILIALAVIAIIIASVAKKKDIKSTATAATNTTTNSTTPVVKRLLQSANPLVRILASGYAPSHQAHSRRSAIDDLEKVATAA